MVETSWQLLTGVFLFLAFMSPIAAGYMYAGISERMDSDPLGVIDEGDNNE